jgi:hypothetical protein
MQFTVYYVKQGARLIIEITKSLHNVFHHRAACPTEPPKISWHNQLMLRISMPQPQGRLRITRKPGECYCGDCIQEQLNRDSERDWETCHIWGAVGYNFKSDLTFYNTPSNKNGKLSLKVYCDQSLSLWLSHGFNNTLTLSLKRTTTVAMEEALLAIL